MTNQSGQSWRTHQCWQKVLVAFFAGCLIVGLGAYQVAAGKIKRLEVGILGLANVIVANNPRKRKERR